jgi:hypothetical protein
METPFLAAQSPVPSAWSNMEHRCGDRRPANLAVRLILPPEEMLLGRIRDLSLSGAFVQTHRELRPLTRVIVELQAMLPGLTARAAGRRIEGFVVRNAATGVGIEWSDFAPPLIYGHWTALAAGAPPHTRRSKGRRLQERRIVLGPDWLVYYPVAPEASPAAAAFTPERAGSE